MATDSLRLVLAVLGAESDPTHDQPPPTPTKPTITISRDHGAGGEDIARALARHLGIQCFDRELIDAVARDAKVDRFLVSRVDEHATGPWDDWVTSVIWGKRSDKDDFRRHLANVLVGIASVGGVVLGRGAHLILAPTKCFRVRITGSEDACAARLAREAGLTLDAARRDVRQTNADRAQFIRQTYHRELNDAAAFDLTLNTDRIPTDTAVRLIATAVEETR